MRDASFAPQLCLCFSFPDDTTQYWPLVGHIEAMSIVKAENRYISIDFVLTL